MSIDIRRKMQFYGGAKCNFVANVLPLYALYLKVLTQKDFVAEFHRENASFTRKSAN